MEKTINCAKCDKSYTYDANPKYPRKYCLVCSAIVKEAFTKGTEQDPNRVTEVSKDAPRPDLKQDVVETIDMGETWKTTTPDDDPLEYQIRSREVRCRALECAIEVCKQHEEQFTTDGLLGLADKFVEWIINGK